ncbi:putative membrane protein, DUF485 family [Abditibacterium utsteinense]|uniref:Putative membrane protein, DUF485 family n=1 Tax=Abditibacterium utsteinense TaxID=1960156 RepID=A0A2S8SWM2_9BACT|nr:DUF485 domain-containing protein [Abditibacterium utsteinense]PQV65159.1 putative membrane protein, DUF485 family [Abditibacterium utsteinense]
MQSPSQDPQFQELVRAKSRLSRTLSLLMFAAYFGFVLLLAWAPEVLSQKVGSATLGIPLGIGVIVFAWILTGIYVRWANGAYDSMVARVKAGAVKTDV